MTKKNKKKKQQQQTRFFFSYWKFFPQTTQCTFKCDLAQSRSDFFALLDKSGHTLFIFIFIFIFTLYLSFYLSFLYFYIFFYLWHCLLFCTYRPQQIPHIIIPHYLTIKAILIPNFHAFSNIYGFQFLHANSRIFVSVNQKEGTGQCSVCDSCVARPITCSKHTAAAFQFAFPCRQSVWISLRAAQPGFHHTIWN